MIKEIRNRTFVESGCTKTHVVCVNKNKRVTVKPFAIIWRALRSEIERNIGGRYLRDNRRCLTGGLASQV